MAKAKGTYESQWTKLQSETNLIYPLRQTYIEFDSVDATSTAKHLIDKMPADGGHLGQKKIQSQYWNPHANPFRTLPKDAPTRGKDQARSTTTTPYNERGNYSGHNNNFRGRGGFNGGRGGMNQNYNRGFNHSMGYNNNNNSNMGAGFAGPNQNNFAFNNRGNMMGGGMRGGPGIRGRGGNMMGMNPMGNMGNMGNMGGMGGMGMGMPSNMGMGMMGHNGMTGTMILPLSILPNSRRRPCYQLRYYRTPKAFLLQLR